MAAEDPYKSYQRGVSAPAKDAFEISPSDGNDLPFTARALYVGGGGDVEVVTAAGNQVLFRGVGGGSVLPCSVQRVRNSNTTATYLVGLI